MADGQDHPRASFKAMTEGTQEDWVKIAMAALEFNKSLAERVLTHLRLLGGDFGGFPVDRLQHSLQAATLAHRDGMDEEYVVCALIHDIGDTLCSTNHADAAAAILKPFVSEQNHWMVEHHAIFQGYYFFHYLGLDRNMREQFRGHPHFERTERFIDLYDGPAFDPAMECYPLEMFEPMVRRVFLSPQNSIYRNTCEI